MPENKTTIALELCLLAEPISKQLHGHLKTADAERLDRDQEAIRHCAVMGYLDDRTTLRAWRKLARKVDAALPYAT